MGVSRAGRASRWVLVLVVVLVSLLAGCHSYYDTGLEALKAGNWEGAEAEARAGLKEEPRDPALSLLLAQALVKQEQYNKARKYAQRAVRGLPDDPQAHATHARVQEETGARIEAATHYLRARELDPKSVPDTERLTKLLPRAAKEAMEADLPESAVKFLEALRGLDPQNGAASDEAILAAKERLGQKLGRQGRYEQAAALYGELAQSYPAKDHYLLEQGAALLTLARDADAEGALARYVEVGGAGKAAERWEAAGDQARLRRRDEVAARCWEKAVAADGARQGPRLKLAELRYQAGQEDAGFEALRASLGQSPTADRYVAAAEVAVRANRGEVAIELLREGLDKLPQFDLARRLAELLLRRDRRGEVEDTFARLVEKQPTPEAKLKATLDASEWLEGQKELDTAILWAEKGLAMPGAPATAWLRLASLLGARGRRSSMVEAVNRYLLASPKEPKNYVAAGTLLLSNKLYDDAERVVQEGLRGFKEHEELHTLLADVYDKGGWPEREVKLWEAWVKRQKDAGKANLQVARRYINRTQLEQAEPFLMAATGQPDTQNDAWLLLGELYQKRGRDKEMRAAFAKYLDTSSDRASALKSLLPRYSNVAYTQDAIAILEELLKLKPDDHDRRYEIGRRWLLVDRADKALPYLERYIQESPQPSKAARRVGQLLRSSKQHELALALYDVLLKGAEGDPARLADMGDLYWETSQDYTLDADRKRQLQDTARVFWGRFLEQYQPEPEEKERRMLQVAGSLVRRGEHELGLRAYARARELKLKFGDQDYLNLGQAQLSLGKVEDAGGSFKRYVDQSGDKPPALFKVAEVSWTAGAYDLALRYLRRILDEGHEPFALRAFEVASQILIHTGEADQLPPLALRTLEVTRAPYSVRIQVAGTYIQAGLWEEAVSEYRDLARLRPGDAEMIRRLAEALYLSGDPKEAWGLFQDAAQASPSPSQTWETIGFFYAERGETELGLQALDEAKKAGAPSSEGLVRRGLLLAMRGKFEEAEASIEEGFAQPGDHAGLDKLLVEVLSKTPRAGLALKYARQGSERTQADPDALHYLAEYELTRGDTARGLRDARRWREQAKPKAYVLLMLATGHDLEALDALRDEVSNGTPESLELLFLEDGGQRVPLEAALEQGGTARLPLLSRPLLEIEDLQSPLHENLGRVYAAREGGPDATLHLSAASAKGSPDADLVLGRLQLGRGEPEAARVSFSRYIARASEPEQMPARAREAALSWLFLAHADGMKEAEGFVRGAMASPGRESLLTPLLVELLLMQNRHEEALSLLRTGALSGLLRPTEATPGADAARLADLLEAARLLGRYGFRAEAVQLLKEVAQARPQAQSVTLGLMEVGGPWSEADLKPWLQAHQDLGKRNGQSEPDLKLAEAEALLKGGDFASAKPLLLSVVTSWDRPQGLHALDLLLEIGRSLGDEALLDEALSKHLKAREDKHGTLLSQAHLLTSRGLYGRAAQRHKEAARLSPQEQNRGLVRSSVLAGQGEQALTTRAQDERRARVTLQQRQEFGEWLGSGPEVSWAKRYWEEVAKDFPQLQAAHLGRARVSLEEGDVAGAKKSLEALLDASGDDPNALAEALELWGEYGRWSELLDMGNARIPKEQTQAGVPVVPPRAWVSVGQAAYAVGKRERALELWDRAIEGSPDALQVKLRVARLLLGEGAWVQDKAQALRDARTYAERVVQDHAASPEAWLLRGEVRLRQGDKAGAWEDVSRGLSMGSWEQPRELGRLGALLLGAGEGARGEELLVRLMELPTQPGVSGLSEALNAFLEAGKPAEGLAFVRKHAPALASAPWVDEGLCSRVAELWAESGQVEQAVKLYEAGLVRFPRSGTLQNNLAWLLARKDKDLGRAERLALGALAAPDLSDEDRAVKLDTLAYIHHKQGNKGALAEQRQAAWLVGQGPKAGDVYARLGDLLEAQGDKAGAVRARERSARQRRGP